MPSEKRSHPRFTINQLVEVDFGHERYISAVGVNLSRSGVLCVTDEECPLYSTVLLMMTVPHHKKQRIINLEGVVNRSVSKKHGWETGINITSMNKASRSVFDEVIHHLHS
jgi:hypothetical protein